ncbi:MAG: hypothetical protein K9J45_21020 [Bacteroidales bacterium]|nr:hypothetical protein [Bacteroidales bacterium]MCF8314274.1 hypothetical protein [Saprospiraceae bacterium]MCF8443107.1 hypothetical protein [Saprospiraceae bacterium]
MINKQMLLVGSILFLALSAFGQLEKTIHQTFDLASKANVELDLYGEYTLIPWAGNNILVETKIQLFNSSASILKHFIEKDQRYLIEADTSSNGLLKLYSHDMKRSSLRTKTGAESTEVVETRIFIPENFIIRDDKNLVLEAAKN